MDLPYPAVDNKMYKLKASRTEDWLSSERVACLDIETTDFSADIGLMLSWSIKYIGDRRVRSDVITKKELFDGSWDRRILKNLLAELKNADSIVTYFGTGFDNVFLRTRALILGIDFPPYGSITHYDVYYTAKSKLKLHSKRLDSVAQALGCSSQKTPVKIAEWQRARWGDTEALAYVLRHNKLDVKVLEEVYHKLRPFVKVTRRSI